MATAVMDSVSPPSSGTTPTADRKRVLDRLLLPVIKLKNSASSKQLEQKLNYLWSAAHALLATSPALAHATAASILETARQQRAQLPPAVLDYLCQQCGGLAVPSVTADVRVVPQRATSAANRKLARQQRKVRRDHGAAALPKCERLLNVVATTCHRCGFVNARHGASVIYKPKQKKLKQKQMVTKRLRVEKPSESEPLPKRAKASDVTVAVPQLPPVAAATAVSATAVVVVAAATVVPLPPRSVFAKPMSPPRRLLDSKKKKKKPTAAAAAATAQVKSSLDSFLQTLRK